MRSAALFLGLLSTVTASAQDLEARIVGGSDANITDYPWQLALSLVTDPLCGGVIVSKSWFLTAASCIHGLGQPNITVRAGSRDRLSGGYMHQVAHISVHELYVPGGYDYDIAALRVPIPFILGDAIAPVELPPVGATPPAPGTRVRAAGWGLLGENATEVPRTLQQADLVTVAREDCVAAYAGVADVTERMVCAVGAAAGVDLCVGDAGDALVCGSMLVGVSSWGRGCAREGYPGVYTDITPLRQWILDQTGV